jgi:hypothetical protein
MRLQFGDTIYLDNGRTITYSEGAAPLVDRLLTETSNPDEFLSRLAQHEVEAPAQKKSVSLLDRILQSLSSR